MSGRRAAARVLVAAVVAAGCDATFRHKALTTFFDGVPPLGPAAAVPGQPAAGTVQARPVAYRAHGPYAARLCDTCHVSGRSNALAASNGELCFQCHASRLDKAYVHGPVASGGGCLVCHDPHGSQYEHLLVSASDDFCYYCHDRAAVASLAAHAGGEQQCTVCHDAHMSDKPHLLR